MSNIVNVSQKLGQYMLNGWVLTDEPCTTLGCRVPLLRSPHGVLPLTHFCPNCDHDPDRKPFLGLPYFSILPAASPSSTVSKRSEISTPPTDVVSNPPDSPQLTNTEEIRHRRDQSDTASHEIGNRLLQGWTMLADECPNPTCYGVPLVRPPKDSRKECVICGVSYVDSIGLNGNKHPPSVSVTEGASSGVSRTIPTASDVAKTGREIATQVSLPQLMDADVFHVFEESSKSLQATLHRLSTRLASLSAESSTIDPTLICSTADAILKVTQALSQVKELERSERQHAYHNLKPQRSLK